MPRNPELDALALRLVQDNTRDAWDRFVASFREPWARREAERAKAMRDEFAERAGQLLAETDYERAMGHALWVSRNAAEVVHRWAVVRRAFAEWCARETTAFRVEIERGG